MLSQLPTPAPGQLENWLIPAAAVASMALLFKKLFGNKVGRGVPTAPPPDLITRTELHQELGMVRDKIDARFLSLSEKIEHLGATIHEKLTAVESAVARIDERTKK